MGQTSAIIPTRLVEMSDSDSWGIVNEDLKLSDECSSGNESFEMICTDDIEDTPIEHGDDFPIKTTYSIDDEHETETETEHENNAPRSYIKPFPEVVTQVLNSQPQSLFQCFPDIVKPVDQLPSTARLFGSTHNSNNKLETPTEIPLLAQIYEIYNKVIVDTQDHINKSKLIASDISENLPDHTENLLLQVKYFWQSFALKASETSSQLYDTFQEKVNEINLEEKKVVIEEVQTNVSAEIKAKWADLSRQANELLRTQLGHLDQLPVDDWINKFAVIKELFKME